MRRTVLPLAAVAVVLAACASDGPAVSGGGTVESTMLDGVPEDCQLVDDVLDETLQELRESIDPAIQRGPLVVVSVEDTRVAATTRYGDPNGYGPVAAWVVGSGPGSITAANEDAAAMSSFDLAQVDTASEGPVAHALAGATDCSQVAAERARPDLEPTSPPAQMRDDLITVTPAAPTPGAIVEVTFTEETTRGLAWNLDRRAGGDWSTEFWLVSDANGGQPTTVPAGTEGFGVDDVGIGGTGPDRLLIPEEVDPGQWRLCTANRGEEICASLEIVAP